MNNGKILVVDDENIVCLGIEVQLVDAGYKVTTVNSGEEALQWIKKSKFKVALVDLMMPDMDGLETCKALKKVQPNLQVVIFSGHPGELDNRAVELIEAGAAERFLYKPFKELEILDYLKELELER